LLGSIEVNGPGVRIAGVLVLEHARHRPLAPDLTVDAVEPQLVPHNPAAVHAADVIDVDELERGAQARTLERLRVVAALQRVVRTAEVELASEGVRPFTRDGIEYETAGLGLGQSTRDRHDHFLSGGNLRHVSAATAAPRPPHVDAVRVN